MMDLGSVRTINDQNSALRIIATDKISFWIRGAKAPELHTYSKNSIPIAGKTQFSIAINHCVADSVDSLNLYTDMNLYYGEVCSFFWDFLFNKI